MEAVLAFETLATAQPHILAAPQDSAIATPELFGT